MGFKPEERDSRNQHQRGGKRRETSAIVVKSDRTLNPLACQKGEKTQRRRGEWKDNNHCGTLGRHFGQNKKRSTAKKRKFTDRN